MTARFSPSSLRWQLSWKLTVVQGSILILVNLGFIALVLAQMTLAPQADRAVAPAIAQSLAEHDGRLVYEPSKELARLLRDSPGLWFRAMDEEGRTVGHGTVAPEYDALVPKLGGLAVLEVKAPGEERLTAAVQSVRTSFGYVRILHGGRIEPGSPLWNLLSALKVLYLPSTLLPMLAALIAIPIIVGRALRGLDETARRADAIKLSERGPRLPVEGVVDEVRPLVNAVNDAFLRVDRASERRQRFLADAAHELRTPIAVLQTRIETLPPTPERARLLTDVGRLGSTAEQLLNMQRVGQEELRMSTVDAVTLCRQVVADIAPIAIDAGYDLSLSSDTPSVLVHGNGHSLSRAVSNLVMNAVEHAGGRGDIVVHVHRDGCIDVIDEGPGVPPEHQEMIFEPFYRVRPQAHGAGLGLSLVQEIAVRHQGSVEVADTKQGARFRLRLCPAKPTAD